MNKIKITGDWNGQPIWREETAEDRLRESFEEEKIRDKEKVCVCGDLEMQHTNACEQCLIPECGCKEFQIKHFCRKCEGEINDKYNELAEGEASICGNCA